MSIKSLWAESLREVQRPIQSGSLASRLSHRAEEGALAGVPTSGTATEISEISVTVPLHFDGTMTEVSGHAEIET